LPQNRPPTVIFSQSAAFQTGKYHITPPRDKKVLQSREYITNLKIGFWGGVFIYKMCFKTRCGSIAFGILHLRKGFFSENKQTMSLFLAHANI
jgi:hypothetical protein